MIRCRCPYCSKENELKVEQRENKWVYICPNKDCNETIHRDFPEKNNVPRAFIGLVGFAGHGKTVYITSLFYLLTRVFENEWTNYSFKSLDEYTSKIIFSRDKEDKDKHQYISYVYLFEKESKLPESTLENFPKPALLKLKGVPFFKDYFLTFYDVAGEIYEDENKITDRARLVVHSEIILFVISIADCGNDWVTRARELLDRYIRAAYNYMRVELKKNQHLIVVLTKADSLINPESGPVLSEELSEYLKEGSYRSYLDLNEEGIRNLEKRSKIIKEWLEKNQCKGFIKVAKDSFKSVEYTIVSSTGAKPNGRDLATELKPEHPKLVLDPFLWILKKTRPRTFLERLFGR